MPNIDSESEGERLVNSGPPSEQFVRPSGPTGPFWNEQPHAPRAHASIAVAESEFSGEGSPSLGSTSPPPPWAEAKQISPEEQRHRETLAAIRRVTAGVSEELTQLRRDQQARDILKEKAAYALQDRGGSDWAMLGSSSPEPVKQVRWSRAAQKFARDLPGALLGLGVGYLSTEAVNQDFTVWVTGLSDQYPVVGMALLALQPAIGILAVRAAQDRLQGAQRS